MKFITFVAALAALTPAALAALTVNTPSDVVECEPTQILWSGGTAPYYLTFTPAAQPSAPAIKQFPTQTGNSYTWLVDLAAGVSFTIVLKDSAGETQYSDIVTITAGSSSTCLNSSVNETGSGSTASSTGSSGSTGTATSASSKSTTTTTSSSSAADRLSVSSAFGVAGVMGLVGAALF